jgi:tetratricopeptide (TPR) repeat protein
MMKTVHLSGVFFVVILLLISLSPASSFGEILTIKQTVKQTFGGGQSADDARIYGIAKAKREALEKAGTYIESLTVVKNSKVEKDEILALTAGVLKAEVVSQKNYASDDAFGIEIIVNVVVDTSVLEERVKKLLQDKTHLTELKETQKREKELLHKVAQLEEENRKLTANKQSTEKLKKQFQQASQGLTAVEWFYNAAALWDGSKFTDPKKAIEYLDNAIKLQPDYANAYIGRGLVYSELGQQQRAIEDFNEAIRFKPDDARAYFSRGIAYFFQGNNKLSCRDAQKACALGECGLLEIYKSERLCH